MEFKRKEKQDCQDGNYEEEDYQAMKKIFEPMYKIHNEAEAIYSTRSINKMFERMSKEFEGLEEYKGSDTFEESKKCDG